MRRREFLRTAGTAALAAGAGRWADAAEGDRPNILWITCEDINPHLGCYGIAQASTPNLDALAARGMRYSTCWSTYPVCAPARTTLITGVYPVATGGEHMRSQVPLPADLRMYPQLLRAAGYYCTNNAKEDYNVQKPGAVWDESSRTAHWRNRPAGRPFFAVFNLEDTHEGQVRRRPHTFVHDPAKTPIPPYHPDTPEAREGWAQYHDQIGAMDARAGKLIAEVAEAGLADRTIVVFCGDNGAGLPRSKRFVYDSGLHVPLIVQFPEKYRALASRDWKPGAACDCPVAFVDFAPTFLSLAGVKPPDWMQGRAFLGPHAAPDAEFVFGYRGRMDERYDLSRSVRDRRFIYIRNYTPHRIYGQHVSYLFQTPTTQAWKRLYDEGKLKPPQTFFWEPKPAEELYDLEKDPHEVRNLADSAEHRPTLERMRKALADHLREVPDLGFLPESDMHARAKGRTPYDVWKDRAAFPFQRILETAEKASSRAAADTPALVAALGDADAAVRWWGVTGLRIRGGDAVSGSLAKVREMLGGDPSPAVRVAAAEALGLFGEASDLERSAETLIGLADANANGPYVATEALNAFDALGAKKKAFLPKLKTIPRDAGTGRGAGYANRLLSDLLGTDAPPQGGGGARAARRAADRAGRATP